MFRKSEFLSKGQLQALNSYKYRAIDKSFVSKYILSHYWNWCVQFFPMNMAPNMITLTGLGFMVINVLLTCLVAPHMAIDSASGPQWLYFSFAIGLWLYSTFDNVDGKQARRTNSSSPLGELFDHGCDAINCSFAAILQATALGMGHSKASVILYGIAMLGFYLSTLEEYHTGILYLGYINAPTEGVVLSCFVFIISGIYGPQFWQMPLNISWLPFLSRSHAVLWSIGILFLFTHVPACFYSMYKVRKDKNFFKTMLAQNMPIVIYITSFYLWITSPYSYILSGHHFILFAITTGIVFGRMATKIILAHLTKSSFPKFTVLLIPLILGALLTNLPRFAFIQPLLTERTEYILLWSYFFFAFIVYVRWAWVVIQSFCRFLGIQCLKITPKKEI